MLYYTSTTYFYGMRDLKLFFDVGHLQIKNYHQTNTSSDIQSTPAVLIDDEVIHYHFDLEKITNNIDTKLNQKKS